MNEQQLLILDSLERLLGDLCTPEVVDQAENGVWPEQLWQALTETGLTLAGISEEAGGSGGDLADSLLVIREAARFAAPVPLAEHFMAARLLEQAGLSAAQSPMTVATGEFSIDGGKLVGRADDVAFAQWANEIILVASGADGEFVCRINASDVDITAGVNLAGEPCDSISVDVQLGDDQYASAESGADKQIGLMGAALRGLMMAGALESTLQMSVQYAMERTQFGRPISKFQAIQQQLAILAGESAASTRAAHGIVNAFASLDEVDIAIGKARIGEAVSQCADIAHQVHGAMGYTLEHSLNHRTRRLWSWRDDYGSERQWQILVGQAFLQGGADSLWTGITERG